MTQPRWFSSALFALALGLAAIAVLGPLVLGVIEYRYSETMLNQAAGLDGFALLVVAPVATVAGILARRQHRAAPLLALGPAGFATYMLTQYVIGPEYLLIDGNGERFFLLFVALFVLSGAVLLQAWSLAMAPLTSDRTDRRRGALLLVLAAFVVGGLYLGNGFLSAMDDFPAFVDGRAATSEFDEHPTAYWLIATLDLAVVVPITVATAVGLLRRRQWARRAYYGVIGWFALVPGSVAAMAIVMVVRDDPAADPARAVMFTIAAAVFLALAGRSFWTVFRSSGQPSMRWERRSSMRSVTSSTLPRPSTRTRMPRSS